MTLFEQWFIKRIFAREVIQGDHQQRICNLYKMLREAAMNEFTEDNQPTLDDFLRECFESTQWDDHYLKVKD